MGEVKHVIPPKVLKDLVDQVIVDFLVDYLRIQLAAGAFSRNDQVGDAQYLYGDPAFDTLLDSVTSVASEHVGRVLLPTYSYVRLYGRGHELRPHRDRPACEYSVTVHLASVGAASWPLWCRIGKDEPVSVAQEPGDGLLYQGPDTLHWRDPFDGESHLQAFLHYVARDGMHSDQVLDGRESLGRARRERLA